MLGDSLSLTNKNDINAVIKKYIFAFFKKLAFSDFSLIIVLSVKHYGIHCE